MLDLGEIKAPTGRDCTQQVVSVAPERAASKPPAEEPAAALAAVQERWDVLPAC